MADREFITREEAQRLMAEAAEKGAEKGARKLLQDLGIDRHDWREQQADMRYLRDMRQGSEQVKRWGTRAAVMAFVTGFGWLLLQGIRQFIRANWG